MRTLSLLLLFSIGLAPTAVMGLLAFSLFGKTAPCDYPPATARLTALNSWSCLQVLSHPLFVGWQLPRLRPVRKSTLVALNLQSLTKERSRYENPA